MFFACISYRPTDLSLLKEFSKKISFEDFHNSIRTGLSRSSGSCISQTELSVILAEVSGPKCHSSQSVIQPNSYMPIRSTRMKFFVTISHQLLLHGQFSTTTQAIYLRPLQQQSIDKISKTGMICFGFFSNIQMMIISISKIKWYRAKRILERLGIQTSSSEVCIPEFKGNFLLFWHLYGLVFYLETIGVHQIMI